MAVAYRRPTTLLIAAILVLIATLFFWLSAFSTPYIKSIWYLHTREDHIKFGTFGWCDTVNNLCLHHRVGYAWHPEVIDNQHLTGSLILVALTAAFGTLAFFSLMHTYLDLVSGPCTFFLVMLTNLLATISFLLVLICWGVAHHRFKRENLNPKYGAAFIMVILGWMMYLAAIPLVFIGWVREKKYRREVVAGTGVGGTVMTTETTTRKKRRFF